MQKIDLHNYEAFLLDYFEGNLTDEKIAELKAFLVLHPQIEIDLNDATLPGLTGLEESIDFKKDLKKINESAYDDLIIAYLEQILSPQQKLNFEKELLNNVELKAQFDLFSKTNLSILKEPIEIDKSILIKDQNDLELNNTVLLYLEGLLSAQEKISFESALEKDKELQQSLLFYQKTHLIPDNLIQLEHKHLLKKENKIFVLFNSNNLRRMAAAVLFLIGLFTLYLIYKPFSNYQTKELSSISKPLNNQIHVILDSNVVIKNKPTFQTLANQQIQSNQKHKVKKEQFNALVADTMPTLVALPVQSKSNTIIKDSLIDKTINGETQLAVESTNAVLSNTVQTIESTQDKNIYTLANIEFEKDLDEYANNTGKNKFWNKLLNLSNKAKSIGIKGIEAEQKENKTYFFAFNQLSVEKK